MTSSLAPKEVTVSFLSGDEVTLDDILSTDTVFELREKLQKKKPSPDGTVYRIMNEADVLKDDIVVTSMGNNFMAVVKPDLIKTVAGKWRKVSGDHYFIGLEIAADGSYKCNSGQVTDGIVRVFQDPPGGKLNLRRAVPDANDHNFDLDETGRRMTGHCPQSGCRWELEKVD
mmetsp:Transcript_128/g.276  ORF Transcript_128/g.276 Transcript_128/m.276 type:complete len:172 (-) Transcript_128:48-563(-)